MQVGKSSAVVMSQVSSKQEETTLLLPSPSLVAKTVVAIYSADQKKMCTISMGIEYLLKTFRKFKDNENISNLWRIWFPQLLSPST